ncbi:hypothetical protein ACF0H5_016589 [Mactra antiquata]
MKLSWLFLLLFLLSFLQDSCYAKRKKCRNRNSTRVIGRCIFLYHYIERITAHRCPRYNGRPLTINSKEEAEKFVKFALTQHPDYMRKPKGYWLAYSVGNKWVTAGKGRASMSPDAPFKKPPRRSKQCNMLMLETLQIEKTRCSTQVPLYCEEIPPEEEKEDDEEDEENAITAAAADAAAAADDAEAGSSTMSEEQCCSCCKKYEQSKNRK